MKEHFSFGGKMAVFNVKDESVQWAIAELKKKYDELNRLPKKADFDEVTRARIKAFLGPWPRALEAAGLKQHKAKTNKKSGSKKSNED